MSQAKAKGSTPTEPPSRQKVVSSGPKKGPVVSSSKKPYQAPVYKPKTVTSKDTREGQEQRSYSSAKGSNSERRHKPLKKGLVKAVYSGDSVIMLELEALRSNTGPPREIELTLSGVRAPYCSRATGKEDEPFGWPSREFLRKMCIGRIVSYTNEYATPTRQYGLLYVDDEDVRKSMVANGWVEVVAKPDRTGTYSPEISELHDLQKKAQEKKKGKWAGEAAGEKSIRKIFLKYNAFDIFEKYKGKTTSGFVEQVRSGHILRVIFLDSFLAVQVYLAGVQCPAYRFVELESEPFGREARFVTEMKLLHRNVSIILEGIDKFQNLFATVTYEGYNISFDLLKNGLGHFVSWTASKTSYIEELRESEKEAKERQLRIWVGWNEEEERERYPRMAEKNVVQFTGKVVEIINPGTIVVMEEKEEEGNIENTEFTLTLSSILIPKMLNRSELKDPKHPENVKIEASWAYEAKEFLRKKLIGKQVHCVMDYIRSLPTDNPRQFVDKPFWSIYYNKENIALEMVSQGLLSVLIHKEDEDRSPIYEDLIIAENRAKKKGRGKHGPAGNVPIHHVNDLTQSESKPLHYLPFLKRAGKFRGVVEYVFNGARVKLWVPRESCMISLTIAGVRAFPVEKTAEKPPQWDPNYCLGNYALHFTREKLFQRDVDVIVEGCDRPGRNFIGVLFFENKHFALTLLEEGLVVRNIPQLRTKDYAPDYKAAEDIAKHERRNHWADWDEEAEKEQRKKRRQDDLAAKQNTRVEVFETLITEIVDGSTFYYQILGEEHNALEEISKSLKEQDIESLNSINPRPGDYCLAQFSADNEWYRARVDVVNEDGSCLLHYIDYGNNEIVSPDKIKELDDNFGIGLLAPQAHLGKLAFLKTPKGEEDFSRDSAAYLKELVWDKPLFASVQSRDKIRTAKKVPPTKDTKETKNTKNQNPKNPKDNPKDTSKDTSGEITVASLILGSKETKTTINLELIKAGLGSVDKRLYVDYLSRSSQELLEQMKREQKIAINERVNIWRYGEFDSDDEL